MLYGDSLGLIYLIYSKNIRMARGTGRFSVVRPWACAAHEISHRPPEEARLRRSTTHTSLICVARRGHDHTMLTVLFLLVRERMYKYNLCHKIPYERNTLTQVKGRDAGL